MLELRYLIRSSFIIILGILTACFVLESILKITDHTEYDRFVNDKETGLLTYKPNSTFHDTQVCLDNIVEINNLGFHGPNIELIKPKNTFRILVIGGSFIESLQVPIEDMFTTLLQDRLNTNNNKSGVNYEIVPIAFSGNSTFLNILYYLKYASPLKPDLVIYLMTDYEVDREPNLYLDQKGEVILNLPKQDQDSKKIFLKNMMRKSKLMMNIYNRLLLIKGNNNIFNRNSKINNENTQTQGKIVWDKERMLLKTLSQKIKINDAPLLIASWITPDAKGETEKELVGTLNDLSTQKYFYYKNLTPEVKKLEKDSSKSATWSCNNHLSITGQEYVASVLFNYLKTNTFLIK